MWEQVNQIVVREVRINAGREEQPSLRLVDSQSVVNGSKEGFEPGIDGNKKVKGCKRHLIVDGLGVLLSCFFSAANVANVKAAPVVLVPAWENNSRLVKILAERSYRGAIAVLLPQEFGATLELSEKLGQGFVVEPWRWVVEHTFAWVENARRLCRDYEELPEHHESFVYVVMIRWMLRKFTHNRRTR